MKTSVISLFATLLLASVSALALEPGDQAPDLRTSKFLVGKPFTLADLKGDRPCLVEFMASWSENAGADLKMLSKFKQEFSKYKLETLAISAEEEKTLAPLLAKNPLPENSCAVALDAKNASETAYMSSEPTMPCFFLIDKAGVLVWKGTESDLHYVLKSFLEGKFTVNDSKRVAAFRKDILKAAEAKELDKVIDASDEILKILPADSETVKLRMALCEAQGGRALQLEFLNRRIEAAPEVLSLYFSKLDLLLHADPKTPPEVVQAFAETCLKAFKDDPEALNNLAWILLDESEFADAPLAVALKASQESVATMPKDADADLRAAAIDTLARINYSIGRIAKAIELQKQALELWKGSDDEARCKKILDYYKAAEALGK